MLRFIFIALAVWAAGSGGGLGYAQDSGAGQGSKVVAVKPTRGTEIDPRLDEAGKLPRGVRVVPAASMKQDDKDLAARALEGIRQHASLYELGFSEGDWQESELDCPAFPQHLFLRWTRNHGAGDVSMFSASIPRGKAGRSRVIPILRKGYSLFSPAPVNKLTIAAFNQIRDEEHIGVKVDWLAESLCFAALTSARWDELKSESSLEPMGSDTVRLDGNGELGVALELPSPAAGRWDLTYDRRGQLLRTEYTPFGELVGQPLPPTATELRGTPLPTNAPDAGAPMPANKEPAGRPLPPEKPGDMQGKPQ